MTRNYRSPRLLNGLKKKRFYLCFSYIFNVKVSVNNILFQVFGRCWSTFLFVTISVKIITSAMSTQLYGSLLNDCTFLVIHKVKYCMVLSDLVWIHHLTILQYTWRKRKQHSYIHFLSYITLLAVGLHVFDAIKDFVIFKQKHQLDHI